MLGRRSALAERYPAWDTSLVKDEIWWYTGGSRDPKVVLLEPEGAVPATQTDMQSSVLEQQTCL